jgi:hypothetical protein
MRRLSLGIATAALVLGMGGTVLADGSVTLTPAGQRDTPQFGFELEQPPSSSVGAGQPIELTWFLLPPYHVGKIWIEPAAQPADAGNPPSTAAPMYEQSGVVTLPGPASPGAYQIRASDTTSSPEIIATEDITVTAQGQSTATATAPSSSVRATHLATGRYRCATTNRSGAPVASAVHGLTISSGSRYAAAGTRGRYRFSPAGQVVRFRTGYLRGVVARYAAGSGNVLTFSGKASSTVCSLAGA